MLPRRSLGDDVIVRILASSCCQAPRRGAQRISEYPDARRDSRIYAGAKLRSPDSSQQERRTTRADGARVETMAVTDAYPPHSTHTSRKHPVAVPRMSKRLYSVAVH